MPLRRHRENKAKQSQFRANSKARMCDDHVKIDISDTGIGIPADELANVFDEFFRATNARESEKDGTGLGLSIVKQIVERHAGRIKAQNSPLLCRKIVPRQSVRKLNTQMFRELS